MSLSSMLWSAVSEEEEDESASPPPPLARVTPEVPGLRIESWDEEITLKGPFAAHTSYTVTVDPSLRDRNGRTIEGRRVFEVRMGGGYRSLYVPRDRMVVLDPSHGSQLPVYSVNVPSLEVELWAVRPEDYPAFRAYEKERWRKRKPGATVPVVPGRLLSKRTVTPPAERDQLVRTLVDLADGLRDGVGQVIVRLRGLPPFVRPPCGCRGEKRRPESEEATVWVQV
ncbi:MAG: Ig-like domain-containing protein, partial [Candidatus Eisenbacteria bacterium]|nr:Ig-like domain-containing protein [Candidatus Eisenbacteria bacterium]